MTREGEIVKIWASEEVVLWSLGVADSEEIGLIWAF
jgi:hypothetical protein